MISNSVDNKNNKTAQPTLKSSAYNKKIIYLRHRINVTITISLFFIVFIIAEIFLKHIITKDNNEDINIVQSNINELQTKSADIEARVIEVRTYRQLWTNANTKIKNFEGIKIADVNRDFDLLVEKYGIDKPNITISAPEILKGGIYDRQVFDVNLINCTINFNSTTDKLAVNFIEHFLNTLPGYTIINDLEITKTKKNGYSNTDLVDVSTGKISGLTSVKVSFSWYFLKHKSASLTPKE